MRTMGRRRAMGHGMPPDSTSTAALRPANDPARADLFDRCRAFTITHELRAAGLYAYYREAQSGPEPISLVEGRLTVMFGSNNYLGLSTHPRLVRAAQE